MRGFASYLVAGIMVVLALDVIAPPAGLGLSLGAWPVAAQVSSRQDKTQSLTPQALTPQAITPQVVDRSRKTDRMTLPTAVGKQQPARRSPVVLVGCDPVFSPLAASARANFAGRCVA